MFSFTIDRTFNVNVQPEIQALITGSGPPPNGSGVNLVPNTVTKNEDSMFSHQIRITGTGLKAISEIRITDVNGSDLSGVNMSNVNLSGADLTETDFTDADLSGADLSDADDRRDHDGRPIDCRRGAPSGQAGNSPVCTRPRQ